MTVLKPQALAANSVIMPFAPASPAEPLKIESGIAELTGLGFQVAERSTFANDGYFAGVMENRRDDFVRALDRHDIAALVGTRGGYGSNYLLDELEVSTPRKSEDHSGLQRSHFVADLSVAALPLGDLLRADAGRRVRSRRRRR